MSHGIVHFEIPVDDIDRAKRFYGELFGWTFSGQEDYTLIDTGEGGVGGGMMLRVVPEQQVTDYIGVDDVNDTIVRAVDLGATVVVPTRAVPSDGSPSFSIRSETTSLSSKKTLKRPDGQKDMPCKRSWPAEKTQDAG